MAVLSQDVKFFSTTQESYGTADSRHDQLSQVRSFLSSRMHARRRAATAIDGRNLSTPKTRTPRVTNSRTTSWPVNPGLQVIKPEFFDREAALSEADDNGVLFPYTTDVPQPSEESDCSRFTFPSPRCASSNPKFSDKTHEEHSNSDPSNTLIVLQQDDHHDPERKWQYRTITDEEPAFAHENTELGFVEIPSTLDPFFRLPIEASPREKALIHFYLECGRRWILGTSAQPKYCPAIELARVTLEISPIWSLTRVVLGELMVSKMCQRPPRDCYFKRSAEMYQTANKILTNVLTSPCERVHTLMQISIVEHVAGRSPLKAMHLNAMEAIVESSGGLAAMLADEKSEELRFLLMRYYQNPLLRTEVPIRSYTQFAALKLNLLGSMEKLQDLTPWFFEYSGIDQDHGFGVNASPCDELRPLMNYLYHLVHSSRQCSPAAGSSSHDTGVLCCIYSFAMTLVEHRPSPQLAFKFFALTQQCMMDSTPRSTQPGEEMRGLKLMAVSDIIGNTRCQVFPSKRHWGEIRIAQLAVAFNKLCHLLSDMEKLEMAERILENVLPVRPSYESLTERKQDYLHLLDQCLERAWWTVASPEF